MTMLTRTLGTAIKALRRNVMRSALTTLGIVIGVGAVITMMEIGNGSAAAVQDTISRMGANNLMIQAGAATSGGVSFGGGSNQSLTVRDVEALIEECSDYLTSVAPVVYSRTQVVFGAKNWVPFYLYGTTPEYIEVREWQQFDEGEMFTEQDVRGAAQVCVLGKSMKESLFGDQSPIGLSVRINNQPFKVVGVLAPKGANMLGMDQDDILLAPWTSIKFKVAGRSVTQTNQSAVETTSSTTTSSVTLNERYPSKSLVLYPTVAANMQLNNPRVDRAANVNVIWARVGAADDIPTAQKMITETLRRQHRLRAGAPNDFTIRDMTEQNNVLGSTSQLMSGLLLSVALISLVVGGVGIMNIMLVSVTERTREIGLRMAVGARQRDILRQFLVEAVLLCLIGGGLGIALGRGAAELVRYFLQWPTQVSLGAIFAAVTVSGLVGVLFGFYPAWKASRLDPIQALRYE